MESLGDSSLLFICKTAMEWKPANLPTSFSGGCPSGDTELLPQGDRMASPLRLCAALAVPGATHDEGDSGMGGRGHPALLQQQGWCLLILRVFCHQLAYKIDGGSPWGLGRFNKVEWPAMSTKRDCPLPGAGLGDLGGYFIVYLLVLMIP